MAITSLYYLAGKREKEYIPHSNWPIIFIVQLNLSLGVSVIMPSIYQYITTSRTKPEDEEVSISNENGSAPCNCDHGVNNNY